VVKAMQAHRPQDKAEAAYARGNLFAQCCEPIEDRAA
jgi:hypothetical protein